MITDSRRDKAITYLAETDSELAELEGEAMRREFMFELVKDRVYLTEEGNVETRKARSRVAAESSKAHEEWIQAVVALKRIKAKRETERVVWETWRSENSNRRQGQ